MAALKKQLETYREMNILISREGNELGDGD